MRRNLGEGRPDQFDDRGQLAGRALPVDAPETGVGVCVSPASMP